MSVIFFEFTQKMKIQEAVSKASRTQITQKKNANFRKSYAVVIQHNIEY
jgi:hypothetical protein